MLLVRYLRFCVVLSTAGANFMDRFVSNAVDQSSDKNTSGRIFIDFFLKHQHQSTSSGPTPSPATTETPYSIFLHRLQNNWRPPNFSIKTFQLRHGIGSDKMSTGGKAKRKKGNRGNSMLSIKSSKKEKGSKRKSSEQSSNSSDKKMKKRMSAQRPSIMPTTLTPTARLEAQPSPTMSPKPTAAILQDSTASPTTAVNPTRSPTIPAMTSSPTPNPSLAMNATTLMPSMQTVNTTTSTMLPTSAASPNRTAPPTSIVPTPAPTPNQATAQPSARPSARPTTIAPTSLATTATPTPPQPSVVTVPRFFIAMAAPGVTRSPTDDEYNTLTDRTAAYFSTFLNETYAANDAVVFESLDLALNNTRFGLGVPEPQYNIYMDFVMRTQFSPTSTPDTPAQIFNLLIPSINSEFILNEVRTVPDSPFTTVNEAAFAAAVTLK